eukprot:764728-Hanusia_phi.AAC.2
MNMTSRIILGRGRKGRFRSAGRASSAWSVEAATACHALVTDALVQREVRLCAERFLSLLSGHVQGKVKEQSSQLWGLPHLTAYSRCTSARSIYQVCAIGMLPSDWV